MTLDQKIRAYSKAYQANNKYFHRTRDKVTSLCMMETVHNHLGRYYRGG